MQEYDVVYVKL